MKKSHQKKEIKLLHAVEINISAYLKRNQRFKDTVRLHHRDGSLLQWEKAFAFKTEGDNGIPWVWIITEHHGRHTYALDDIHYCVEQNPRGKTVASFVHLGEATRPYFKRLEVWTIEHQKRYCDLIHRHASPNRNAIAAIELDELDWLSKERKRLGYPIAKRERVSERKLTKLLHKRLAKY